LASVIQSEIFNRYAIARLARGGGQLLSGEVVRLEGSRALFVVDSPEQEQARLDAGDLHLTGPIWGPKMKTAQGEALALESEVLASLDLSAESLRALGRSAPGTRRDLLLRPSELSFESLGPRELRVELFLPAGAYASLVVRALTRGEPWGRTLDAS
jgi:tRNA pseudouridine13 synthase